MSVDETYVCELRLLRCLPGFGIEPRGCDHRTLAPLGDNVPKISDGFVTHLRGPITLGLDEQLDPGQVRNVELADDVHAAIAGFAGNLGLLEAEGLQQGPGQLLELGGIQLENAAENDLVRVL